MSWDGHAVGTWTAGGVPWLGTFKQNWTGKVLPARDSQLTSVPYLREGACIQEGVRGGAVPLVSLPCHSHLSACHPQQDSELYRWQPTPTQNWPPQLQALPERDRQEGEAAEEVAGRWVEPEGCRAWDLTTSCIHRWLPCRSQYKTMGRALWGRDPLEPLCSQQGESESQFLILPRAFSLSCEMAVFWGYTKSWNTELLGVWALPGKSQWNDGGQHVGKDSQGLAWSHSPQPMPGSRPHPVEASQSSPWGICVYPPGCPTLLIRDCVHGLFAEQCPRLLRARWQGP